MSNFAPASRPTPYRMLAGQPFAVAWALSLERLVLHERVREMIADVARGRFADFFDLGFNVTDLPALSDVNVVAGLSVYAGAVWLAEELVEAWEGGFETETDAPAPVTPANIRRLLRTSWNGRPNILLHSFMCWVRPAACDLGAEVVEALRDIGRVFAAVPDAAGASAAWPDPIANPLPVQAVRIALDEPYAWHRAGAAGPLIGVDYDRCIEMNPRISAADPGGFVRCLRAIEEGALERAVRH